MSEQVPSKEIGTRLEWRKREADDDGCRWSLVLVGDHGEELWAVLSSPTPLEVRSPDEPAQPLTTLSSPRSALWRHMHDEHGLTLLESELDEIELLAKACSADEPPADDMAPIACIRVGEDDTCEVLKLYAPGLPPGEHDLYPAASSQPPAPEWQPIETAPRDGTPILVSNEERDGAWIAYYCPVYQSGYRPENPWSSLMLNTRWHKNTWASYVPTRWMTIPLPYSTVTKECE